MQAKLRVTENDETIKLHVHVFRYINFLMSAPSDKRSSRNFHTMLYKCFLEAVKIREGTAKLRRIEQEEQLSRVSVAHRRRIKYVWENEEQNIVFSDVIAMEKNLPSIFRLYLFSFFGIRAFSLSLFFLWWQVTEKGFQRAQA